MNKKQQLFILLTLSKLAQLGTFYFGFWVFVYEIAWWNKPAWYALMSGAVSLVLCVLCLCGWIVFDMWLKDPSTIPTFKIERGKKKEKTKDKPEEKKKDKKLPLW